jgi:predicted nucleic acid-binding protein
VGTLSVAEATRTYLDTNALIAILEKEGALDERQRAFVNEVDAGDVEGVTSELTLAECLVKPIADRDEALVRAYLSLLGADSAFLRVAGVSRPVLLEAARIRAGTGVKLPDAIHVATAHVSGCAVFVSNDRRLASACPMEFRLWSEMGTP